MKKTSRRLAGLGAVAVCTAAPVIGASHVQPRAMVSSATGLAAGRALVTLSNQATRRPDPQDLFKRQCVVCHGEKGEGDGPAAPAFNPAPSNLTDSELIGERSDTELREVLTTGKGSMPAFGPILKPEEIESLVSYIRKLSDGGSAR